MCDMDYGEGFDLDSDVDCDMDCAIEEGCDFDLDADFSEEVLVESEFEDLESYEALEETAEDFETYALAELEDVAPELTMPAEELESLIEENGEDIETLMGLRGLLTSGRVGLDIDEIPNDSDDEKVLSKRY